MPVSEYYGGHGKKVMREMKKRYGKKKGESVFYATHNKRKKKKKGKHHSSHSRHAQLRRMTSYG